MKRTSTTLSLATRSSRRLNRPRDHTGEVVLAAEFWKDVELRRQPIGAALQLRA